MTLNVFRGGCGPRDRRGYDSQAKASWDEVAAWNPRSHQLPQEGFCEDCKKKVMVNVDRDPQTCQECGGSKVRKLKADGPGGNLD